jgi:hypothetical protein
MASHHAIHRGSNVLKPPKLGSPWACSFGRVGADVEDAEERASHARHDTPAALLGRHPFRDLQPKATA